MTIQVGAIYTTKRWDCVSFYMITKVTPKRVVVERVNEKQVGKCWTCGPAMQCNVVATEQIATGWKSESVQMSIYNDTALWSAKKSLYLTEWDGQPIVTNL